jgi:hypothetical protein
MAVYSVEDFDPLLHAAKVAALDAMWVAGNTSPWRSAPSTAAELQAIAARPEVVFVVLLVSSEEDDIGGTI